MIGISHIASHIPSICMDNIQLGREFGQSEDFIRKKIGAVRLPRKDADEETSDMAVAAIRKLIEKTNLPFSKIEAIALVTQNGDGFGLPHTSAILHRKLSLPPTVAVFDISLGCSGYVYGLSVLKGFLEAAGMKSGILITADPYSRIVDRTDKNTALLFGDAATATLLENGAEWRIGRPLFWTDGAGAEYLRVHDGRLVMNGRQVFNFAVSNVPRQIVELLEKEGFRQEDMDLYCLHQGSAAIVEAIARHFPTVKDRFPSGIEATGNTVSSSIPLLLEGFLFDSDINRIVLSGFGVGFSLATTILQRKGLCHD
ncbi:MAG: ketoacyl-ACP synthase III [Thermodesulfobacteriota bacterium]